MTTEIKRDLLADLAICTSATSGPWTTSGEGSWSADTKVDGIASEVYEDADATFIAEARTGWPHAIERVINAEEQVGALIELLREATDLIIPNESEYKCDYRRRYIRHQIAKIAPEVSEDE